MNRRFIPTYLAKSIFEITPEFYKKEKISVIFTDLDNTLGSYKDKEAGEEAKRWIKTMKEAGIEVYITSNNTSARVTRFAESLGIKNFSGLAKPFSAKLRKLIVDLNLKKENIVLVGDQIQTDVIAGNGALIRTILTDPIAKIDPIWTKFNRLFDKPRRKTIIKKKLAKSWKEYL